MDSLKLNVELNEVRKLKEFLHEIYQKNIQIDLIVEEIFVNIVNHSKANFVIVNIDLDENLTIEFIDNGIKFNPILKENKKFNERRDDEIVGGYGIMLVKHYVDDLIYDYVNNENHLKIVKSVEYG